MKKPIWLAALWLSSAAPLAALEPGVAAQSAKPPGQGPPGSPSASLETAPPRLRLPATARPRHYAVDLTILAGDESFSGAIDIDLEISEKTPILWLNANDLKIQEASLKTEGRRLPARVLQGTPDFVGFAFGEPVGPGRAALHATYGGMVNLKDTTGLFRQRVGESWYVFSQFEALDARRAFPCFDEPSFKVPWQLTLHVKREHVAFSNTPPVSESVEPGGLKTVKFAETKPLPSYLVALGVGPFEVVDAGKAGQKKVPIRMIVPKGRSSEARHAVQTVGEILNRLEKYFGIPYPYEKLDNLVIPQTVRFGAMENAGLVTYNESILLAKPEEETVPFKRRWAGVCAHETAHQWFGDLVTLAWWDDTWLNESFASWMGSKIIAEWRPEWDQALSDVVSRSVAMGADTLLTARRIRQPIESKDDIDNAFDAITYQKGSAVLSMFESWVGPETFRKGVRRYLTRHAFGNATASDFLTAVESEGGAGLARAFSTFLDQPGVPSVTVELKCDAGGPRLALSQRRFVAKGFPQLASQAWQIPVCARYGATQGDSRTCQLLTAETAEMKLSEAKSCPGWLLANAREVGYYRTLYAGDLLSRLLKDRGRGLTLPERVGLLRDVEALAESGEMPLGDSLKLVTPFAKESNRHILASVVRIASAIQENLVPDDLRPNYVRFVRTLFGERARELTWHPKPGEEEDVQLLRPVLLGLVARRGEDPVLRKEAWDLALRWLDDRRSVHPDLAGTVLSVAAENGDRALFQRIRDEARKVTERRDRGRLLNALGSFRDPALAKEALSLLLTDEFDIRESVGILFTELSDPATRQLAWDFFKQNFDALLAKLPREVGGSLPSLGRPFCDAAHRADLEAFFKDRVEKLIGAKRNLAQTLERIDQCIALKEAQRDTVASFLRDY